jgi:hypothetical protein
MLTEDRPTFRAFRIDTDTRPSPKDGNVIRTEGGPVTGLHAPCVPG